MGELRKLSTYLGLTPESDKTKALAQDLKKWIVTYWSWRENAQMAPNAQEEIVLLEHWISRINEQVEKCNLSVDTDRVLLAAASCFAARVEQLRKTPPPRGPRRDMAIRNLAPLLNLICLSHNERATPKQRRNFAAVVCRFANIPFPDPDSHSNRVDKLLRGNWVGPPPIRPADVIAMAEKAKRDRE